MKVIKVHGGEGDSTILIGEKIENLSRYLPKKKIVIITDTNVLKYYSHMLPTTDIIEISPGEKFKNLDTVRDIYGKFLEMEADRSTFVVGIGGGVVCDIAGFAASTYMRGLDYGFVSSTLLSQVDASVGGKNGVNLKGYKNIVGLFHQPQFVICDPNFLKTLPEEEILCGLSEILKHALIMDKDLFSYLEEHYAAAFSLDLSVLEKLIFDSVLIKSSVVNRDERENGDRRKLNFGHTFGHAFEGILSIPHGAAVGAGMAMAARISEKKGYLYPEDTKRIEALLRKMRLPISCEVDPRVIFDTLKKDKKRHGENIHFVFLKNIGEAVVEEISFKELEEMTDRLNVHRF